MPLRNAPRQLGSLLALCLIMITLPLAGPGCSGDADACVQELGATCQPLYRPEYAEVFTRTLKPRCALEGGSCHSREGAQGGLIMEDMDETYATLLDEGRILPGDGSCSPLLARIGGKGLMPPGAPLSEAERCAVETWVRNGALKQ